ncbi:unnamed protein product [Victoria cruziana]
MASSCSIPLPQLSTARSFSCRRSASLLWGRSIRRDDSNASALFNSLIFNSGTRGRPIGPASITCNAQTTSPSVMASGTPVRATSLLVVGATGTLGRQVVRRALDEGYDVRCLVRPRPTPADFLRDWGATVVNGDLSKPETIPATLVGVHTIIDCATGRPEEPIQTVDWEGKVSLIQCAKAMGIQKYIFFSIHNCDKHPDVPLMEIKRCTEKYLRDSGINHLTIRLCGFMQVVILFKMTWNVVFYFFGCTKFLACIYN